MDEVDGEAAPLEIVLEALVAVGPAAEGDHVDARAARALRDGRARQDARRQTAQRQSERGATAKHGTAADHGAASPARRFGRANRA
jgi:hypothetical protein